MHDNTPASTRQRRKEARPQELLDAALELFVEKGFSATRSEEVATRAGVSKGTLYLYYPSKEELLKAVIQHNLSQLIAEGADLVDTFQGPTAELLEHLVLTWWDRVGDTPASGIMKLMVSEVRNFPEIAEFYEKEVIAPAEALVSKAVQRGIDRGEFRNVPVEEITIVLMAPMLFMILHKHSMGACAKHGQIDPRRVLVAHVDVMLRGLMAAPAGKPARKTAKTSAKESPPRAAKK